MQLDQLTCCKCGEVYHEKSLKHDEFRFSSICEGCRPKPAHQSFTFSRSISEYEHQAQKTRIALSTINREA